MKKSEKILTAVVLIVGVAVIVAAIGISFFYDGNPDNTETPLKTEITTGTDGIGEVTVPPIETDDSSENPKKPDIDITDMERNPNPEVIDSEIEYGTKDGESHEE